eukprot:scaffold219734_cov32-Tisochrysis_lutea.AAC.1
MSGCADGERGGNCDGHASARGERQGDEEQLPVERVGGVFRWRRACEQWRRQWRLAGEQARGEGRGDEREAAEPERS